MTNPLFTIITPSFNQGQFLEQTIESVLNQSYKKFQYIIVDGGSTDSTVEILEKYRSKVDIIIREKDRGQSDAINKGFKLANGNLVGWINSDDLYRKHCLEEIAELYTSNPDGTIYYGSQLDFIDSAGNILKRTSFNIPDREHLLLHDYNVVQPGSFYNRRVIKDYLHLDQDQFYCMDLDLWLKLLNKGPIYAYNEQPLAAFRIWNESKTSNGGIKFLRDIRKTLVRHGSPLVSRNMLRISWYMTKQQVKSLVSSK